MRYMRSILGIFAESPFKPLYSHAEKACEAAYKLEEIVQAYCDGDVEKVQELNEEISGLEHEADIIKQEIRKRVPYSVLLPVNRQDILEFLKPQDGISDCAEDVAKLMTLKSYVLPEEIKRGLTEMTHMTMKAIDAYLKVTESISQLVSTSFRKKDIKETLELIPPVEKLEHEIDTIEILLTKKIFLAEDEIGTLGVFHLAKILDVLGDVSDNAARAVDRLRTMVISI
ncbi:MAG: TIGR00153 family protein [Methanocellales archaeon]|nr:TIGR00153 family protein [Methanocellales archaeon]MDD3292408.1 TIGR00153 family protein [Methanocellales archaeon]MDD5235980.1 TIGR00153 family protein [Methanocellales archaeon]MDD5485287.1 TIGR00153 family protein [Methanocellales archaeon]